MLKMLDDGNKSSGGLGKARVFFGIAGFIRFMAGCMILMTKRSYVALLGGHYLYHCETRTSFLCAPQNWQARRRATLNEHIQAGGHVQELLSQVCVAFKDRECGSSYTYDITSTLQHNLTGSSRSVQGDWALALRS